MNAISKISAANADPSATEVRFPNESILASATDQRGVIGFVNQDFQQASAFTMDELIGAPHKIVRHPDMPKGVFYALWDNLKQGNPMCAYVKNKTKSGKFYWAFAVVTLTENGFISAGIRPGSDLLEQMKSIYADLQKAEAEGQSPEQSGAAYVEALQSAGYPSVAAFNTAALDLEFKARGILSTDLLPTFTMLDELAELVGDMQELVNNIELGFERVRGEPVNLRILAGRLEGAGAALGTISQNYDAMAKEMHTLVGRLHDADNGALSQMHASVSHGRASLQMAQMLSEAHSQEPTENEGEQAVELLREHDQRLSQVSRSRLIETAAIGKTIPDICRSLRRRINGLDVVKLLCKVESGRMREVDSGLDGIIERLENFHNNTDRHLADLSAKASQITQKSSTF